MSEDAEGLSRQVRTWYGLPGEIVIEGDYWHLVRVGPFPLPHPPLVNLFIRRGLPQEERYRLGYWHGLGHLQTLPLAVAHVLWLWRHGPASRPRPLGKRLVRLAAALLVHQAAWELAAESYVAGRAGRSYRRLYRRPPNPFLLLFWAGMAGITLLGTLLLGRRRTPL